MISDWTSEDRQRHVIAACMRDRDLTDQVNEILVTEYFYDRRLARWYRLLWEYYEQHPQDESILDMVHWLKQTKQWQAEDSATLAELSEHASIDLSRARVLYDAREIACTARLDQVQRDLAELAGRLQDVTRPLEEGPQILQDLEATAFRGTEPVKAQSTISLGEALAESVNAFERRMDGDDQSVFTTGIQALDDRLDGLGPGMLTVVGADPSVGKSAFALQLAVHWAGHDIATLIVSMEMTPKQIADRYLLGQHPILRSHFTRPWTLDRDTMTGHQIAFHQAAECGRELKLQLCQPSIGVTVPMLTSLCRRAKRRYNLRALVVDYLQLMDYEDKSEVEALRAITRGAKMLAHDLDIAVLLLSQLNKRSAAQDKHDREPNVHDLHGGSTIYKDADSVILLHRPHRYHEGDVQWEQEHLDQIDLAVINVTKQRMAPPARVACTWNAESTRFVS